MKNKAVEARIEVSIPILKNLSNKGLVLNLGALTLKLGDRNFILDSTETSCVNPQKKGEKFTFETELKVDLDAFEEGEEYNYDLTEDDLKSKDLEAEFFCGDEDVELEDSFDFDNAEINCAVYVNNVKYEIKNVTFE